MKASDLMIGDWVLWKNKPVQVVRVSGIRYEFGHYDVLLAYCNNMGDGIESHDISSISPIPLTADLLGKNGWVNKEEKGWMQQGNFGDSPLMLWYVKDTGTFTRHFANELEISDLSKDGGYRLKIQCKYVHELQHALRLCGLTELAEKFKVD
ncbi:MAG: hypothetical protein MJY60_04135 [Bacteroidales bacterium]|nr:hypothetical protein [Bacteroidales bacterium]